MDEAAPQAAAGADTEEVAKALEVLRLRWELDYLTGYDKEHGWWASRRGVIGHILTSAIQRRWPGGRDSGLLTL